MAGVGAAACTSPERLAGGGPEARAVPAASPAPTAAVRSANGPVVRAVIRGPQFGPVRAVSIATGSAGPAGKQSDRRIGTAKGPRIEQGIRARSASVASTVGGAAAVGGRPIRMRQMPSALNDFEHQAGVKVVVPTGKMCDTCKVKPAVFPDNLKNEWNCAECQFKE